MQKKEKIGLAKVSSIVIGLIIIAGICVYIGLPYIVKLYAQHAHIESVAISSQKAIMAILYVSGIPVIALLTISFLMTLNIGRGQAFVKVNVTYLNLISLMAVLLAVIFAVGYFFLNSVFPIIIAIVFLLLSVLTKVFADLFKKAIEYKTENELTI